MPRSSISPAKLPPGYVRTSPPAAPREAAGQLRENPRASSARGSASGDGVGEAFEEVLLISAGSVIAKAGPPVAAAIRSPRRLPARRSSAPGQAAPPARRRAMLTHRLESGIHASMAGRPRRWSLPSIIAAAMAGWSSVTCTSAQRLPRWRCSRLKYWPTRWIAGAMSSETAMLARTGSRPHETLARIARGAERGHDGGNHDRDGDERTNADSPPPSAPGRAGPFRLFAHRKASPPVTGSVHRLRPTRLCPSRDRFADLPGFCTRYS